MYKFRIHNLVTKLVTWSPLYSNNINFNVSSSINSVNKTYLLVTKDSTAWPT